MSIDDPLKCAWYQEGTDGAWEPAWGEPSRRRLDADAETTRGDGGPNTNPDPDCEHGPNPKLNPHTNRNLKPNPNPHLNSKPHPKPSLNPQPTQTLILTPTLTLTLTLTLTRWRSAQRAATPGAGRLLARRLRVWAEVTARRAREPRWLDLLWRVRCSGESVPVYEGCVWDSVGERVRGMVEP